MELRNFHNCKATLPPDNPMQTRQSSEREAITLRKFKTYVCPLPVFNLPTANDFPHDRL